MTLRSAGLKIGQSLSHWIFIHGTKLSWLVGIVIVACKCVFIAQVNLNLASKKHLVTDLMLE